MFKTFFQGLLVDLSKKAMITGNYKVDISNSVIKQTKTKTGIKNISYSVIKQTKT